MRNGTTFYPLTPVFEWKRGWGILHSYRKWLPIYIIPLNINRNYIELCMCSRTINKRCSEKYSQKTAYDGVYVDIVDFPMIIILTKIIPLISLTALMNFLKTTATSVLKCISMFCSMLSCSVSQMCSISIFHHISAYQDKS